MSRPTTPRAIEPRKAPSHARSGATVAAILEAAARILERAGLNAFNTNAVAALAGVSVGSLYQYFPNKQALLAALVAREAEDIHATVATVADTATTLPLAAGLRRIVAAAIARQTRRRDLARILDFVEAGLPALPETQRAGAALLGAVSSFLARHAASLPTHDIATAAADCVLVARALIDGATERGPIDPTMLEDRVVRTLLGYLAPNATRSSRRAVGTL